MKTPCQQRDLNISRWLDGELEPDTAAELEIHVEGCPDCRAAVAERRELRQRWDLPAPLLSTSADRDLIVDASQRQALLKRQREIDAHGVFTELNRLFQRPLFFNLATAFGVLVAVLLALDLQNQLSDPSGTGNWQKSVPVYSQVEYESVQAGKKLSILDNDEMPMGY